MSLGVQSTQRLALGDVAGGIAVFTWPAELVPQAKFLYSHGRGPRLLDAAADRGREVDVRPHLAYRNSTPVQRPSESSERELTVSALLGRLGLPQPRVSNHLACLRWCGFIEARREGRTVYNRMETDLVAKHFRGLGDPVRRLRIPSGEETWEPQRARRAAVRAVRYDASSSGGVLGVTARSRAARDTLRPATRTGASCPP